ncbi:MAG TPA: zinc-binding dehydrogenase [Solirubrobacteraceae bacterium]|nr:zinc-binding dehydrogenase [Solirubrobacteraceae bacterium]
MRALVSKQSAPFAEITDVPDPTPRHDEVLVEVKAFSLNRGETRRLESLEPGTVTGWDVAGIVREPAPNGSGPPSGARIVGLMPGGAWAELAAVGIDWLAELPDAVSFEQAATLPVAGVTALRGLELGGFVVDKPVLVTGASGGVGRFAIQLASLAGARVTGLARRSGGLRELGADVVIEEIDLDGPVYDVILDAIGGGVLGAAIQRVAPRGIVVSFASTITEPVSYPARELFARAPGARLYGLYIFSELQHTRTCSSDLTRLTELIAAGKLDPQIDLSLRWTDAGQAIEALLDRRVNGKAVLTVD